MLFIWSLVSWRFKSKTLEGLLSKMNLPDKTEIMILRPRVDKDIVRMYYHSLTIGETKDFFRRRFIRRSILSLLVILISALFFLIFL